MRGTRAEQTRHRILAAAREFVLLEGAHKLTLDAVVQQAGVSKGSLLYHFPTKEALIQAMLEEMLEELDRAVTSRAGQQPTRRELLLAYMDALFEASTPQRREHTTPLLAAAANAPQLLGLVTEWLRRWEERLTSAGALPPAAKLALRAAHGCWLAATLGLQDAGRAEDLPEVARALLALVMEG